MWARLWAPLLALTAILAGCGEAVTSEPAATPAPPAATPEPAEPTKPKRQATCDDSAIRLLDREAGVHGAIVDDTLHMGGATAPATCTDPTNESLHAGPSNTDGRAEQVRQSQYYLIVIRYPDGNRLYVISRRGDGTLCVVDTNDQCIAHVTALPDDYDVEDLPEDVPPEIPAGRPAPPTVSPPPASGGSSAPGRPSNPQPRDEATGVTVGGPLLSWGATPLALSYDVYWGATRELAADTALGTPINTSSTFLRISPSADLAADTTYYWRVDAKNDAGATRGDVWSFTTGEPLPSATASSSGYYAGYNTSPDQALDGDDATQWCATSVPAWFRLDLGEVRSVSWLNVNVGSYTVHGNVEVSADGSSWTSVSSFHMTARERRTFTIGRTIRYVRINITQTDAPDSHAWQACISDVSTSVGTTGKAPLPSATASSGRNAGNALDGDDATQWCATSVPAWFRLDLGEVRSVSWLNVNVGSYTVHGNVEVSADGSSWTSVSSFHVTASERRTFTIGRRIRYARINITETEAPDRYEHKACISEVSTDDDGAQPVLLIRDASAREGQTLSFAVTLSRAASRTVTVSYRTSDGPPTRAAYDPELATARSSSDYAAGSGTLRFRAGDTRKTISVRTTDDNRDEPHETFTVRLHNASGATILRGTATGTINDDDGTGFVSATASSNYFVNFPPDEAIDGDDDTSWCVGDNGAWLRLDIGRVVRETRLTAFLSNWNQGRSPLSLSVNVEVSTDGSSWTRVSTFGFDRRERFPYVYDHRVGTIRYVRFNFTRVEGIACIYEVTWRQGDPPPIDEERPGLARPG